MLDVKDLEDRWKKYNVKRKRPFYIGIVVVLISTVILSVNTNIKQFYHDIVSKVQVFGHQDSTNSLFNNNLLTSTIKSQYLLNDKLTILELNGESKGNNNVFSKNSNVSKSLTPLDEDELFVDDDIQKPIITKKTVKIIKIANSSAYRDVEKRFKRSHNINDSIFLANIYYQKKNYKKAIYWAEQTNKLDNNIEESWLIFAKSKYKLGHKNEAIHVLRAYIRRSNSYEAKKLLKKLTS